MHPLHDARWQGDKLICVECFEGHFSKSKSAGAHQVIELETPEKREPLPTARVIKR